MDIQGFKIPLEELLGLTLCKEERDEGEIVESLAKLDEFFVSLESMFTKLSKQDVYFLTACLTYFSIEIFSIARERCWNADNIRTLVPNVWRIHRGSRFIKHIQDWPKGYPGDYQIVNMIVDRNDGTKEFNLSSVLGSHAINSLIAQQHREKIREQCEMIKNVCLDIDSPNIVSIACGPSRDLEKTIYYLKEANAKVFLLDFDEDALDESLSRLEPIKDQVDRISTDIRKIPRLLRELKERNGLFDLVYAGGLFDYLPEGIIKLLVSQICKRFVQDGGCFMFTNINKNNPYRDWIEVLGNWHLIERDQDEMYKIIACTGFKDFSLYKEKTGLTWIAKAFKK